LALALPTDKLFFLIVGLTSGLVIGLDSMPEPNLTSGSKAVTLFAILVSITVITADIAFYTSVLPPKKWIQVVCLCSVLGFSPFRFLF
jgi:hypothetical protein